MARKLVKAEVQSSDVAEADARRLDASINERIRKASEDLAQTYLEVGALLKRMRESEGFLKLGFEKWEHYLDSKTEFGRSYLSYLYKIGSAGDLKAFLERGMSGSKLIEFAKRTDFPEKIPQLIEATWEEVRDKSARETRVVLDNFVREHEAEYRREKPKKVGRPRLTVKNRLEKEYRALPESERSAFISLIKEFVREQKVHQDKPARE